MSRAERPLRILAATLRYPPYVAGGYELLTRDAVEGLREAGHRVGVLCGRGARFAGDDDLLPRLEPDLDSPRAAFRHSFESGNLERFRLHFLRPHNWRATRDALAEREADLLFFFNLGLLSLAPVLAARTSGVPTLGYISDPWPENHWVRAWREDPAQRDGKQLRLAALTRAWRTFRELIGLGPLLVPSEYMRRLLVADGLPAADLSVLPLALSPEVETRARAARAPRRERGQPLRVLAASMLWEGKGLHVLLEAARLAAERGVDLCLEVAGDGEPGYRARLEALARDGALAARVEFSGMLDREELSRRMASAHVFAFPSLWGEPFALAPLEAMAHGLATISSDAGGSPEQFEHGEQGLLVPAGDAESLAAALGELDADEDRRAALGSAAREHALERFGQRSFREGIERAARAASARVGELR